MSVLQVMPFHVQQSVSFCHDIARSPSSERPARNWRRKLFSWSVKEQIEEAKHSTNTRVNPSKSVEWWKQILTQIQKENSAVHMHAQSQPKPSSPNACCHVGCAMLEHSSNKVITSSMASSLMSSEKKAPEALPTVDAGEVRQLMSSGCHYLDVRLGKDFDKAHAAGARNVPYYLSVTPSGQLSSYFLALLS
ncbi:hypothetical protein ABZP36_031654 [Zizania latifolia]